MFIKLLVVKVDDKTDTANFVFFDAHTITRIEPQQFFEDDERCFFVAEGVKYHAQSYTADGLVEVVMQARLHPAQFMPSANVGKRAKPEPKSTGSHEFRANDKDA